MRLKVFDQYPELVYGFSEKADGGMCRVKDYQSNIAGTRNRQKFLAKYRINASQTVIAGLTHSANIARIDQNFKQQVIPNTDGLVTRELNRFLTVTTADCFPVYFYDPINKAVGLVHAGWRGIVLGIVPSAVKEMQKQFKTNPQDLTVGIGPGILPCHFEIQADVLSRFELYPQQIINQEGKIFVDLTAIIKRQLLECGLKSGKIEISGECTYCLKEKYFSFRRDKKLEPMLAVIGIN